MSDHLVNAIRARGAEAELVDLRLVVPLCDGGEADEHPNAQVVADQISAAGGERSHMAIMGLASSLMLDFRSIIVPRYLYAVKSVYPGGLPSAGVAQRIDFLASDLIRFAKAFTAMDAAEL